MATLQLFGLPLTTPWTVLGLFTSWNRTEHYLCSVRFPSLPTTLTSRLPFYSPEPDGVSVVSNAAFISWRIHFFVALQDHLDVKIPYFMHMWQTSCHRWAHASKLQQLIRFEPSLEGKCLFQGGIGGVSLMLNMLPAKFFQRIHSPFPPWSSWTWGKHSGMNLNQILSEIVHCRLPSGWRWDKTSCFVQAGTTCSVHYVILAVVYNFLVSELARSAGTAVLDAILTVLLTLAE